MTEDEIPDEASRASEQYGFFKTDDGDTVVYDRKNPKAWIQSSFAVAVGEKRQSESTA